MTTATKQKTILMIVIGALVAIAPAFFGYLQAHEEIRKKYTQNRHGDEAGYAALASTVKDLQKSVLEQHEYIAKLEGQLTMLMSVLTQLTPPFAGTGSGSTGMRMGSIPNFPAPPVRPELRPPPGDLAAAVSERDNM